MPNPLCTPPFLDCPCRLSLVVEVHYFCERCHSSLISASSRNVGTWGPSKVCIHNIASTADIMPDSGGSHDTFAWSGRLYISSFEFPAVGEVHLHSHSPQGHVRTDLIRPGLHMCWVLVLAAVHTSFQHKFAVMAIW